MKHMKKNFSTFQLFNLSTLAFTALCAANASGAMGTSALTGSTRELNGGTIYTMSEDVTINAAAGVSALTVKSAGAGEGSIVVIDIQGGHTLTVKGGDATGKTGAGAGILLPEGMTLFVTGKGKLNATGGNAANGGNGTAGDGAYQHQGDTSIMQSGGGSHGADGGGGAGAGIGGNGGAGASGGEGTGSEGRSVKLDKEYPKDGKNGNGASGGSNGVAGGSVFILGDISATVKGGSNGLAGSESSTWGTHALQLSSNDHWFSGGGGPGGAGGGGGAASAIGGGGGGSGGSGSFLKVDDWDDRGNLNLLDADGNMDTGAIRGGRGGNGGGAKNPDGSASGGGTKSDGQVGRKHKNYEADLQESTAGNGGNGSEGFVKGGEGSLYVLPSVGLSMSPYRASDGVDNLPQNNFLSVTVTLDLGLKNASGANATTTFQQPFANKMQAIGDAEVNGVNPRVKRPGYRFAGFWTTPGEGGTCVYGPDYKPTQMLSPYTQNLTLYARWEVDSSVLAVTSSGDAASTLDVYGNEAITLRDAVNALVANSELVGPDGRRRVTFEKLDVSNRVVRLSSAIVIPSGTRSFEINGLVTLETDEMGVQIIAGSNSPVFVFQGAASDEGGVFSLVDLNIQEANVSDGSHGGAVRISGGASVSIDACSFIENTINGSASNGGAISVADGSELLVSATTFSGNKSSNRGAAVQVNGAYAFFVNTTFSGNNGGGIMEDGGGQIDLLNCTFAKNTANNSGKSIYSAGAAAKIRAVNCVFADAPAVSMNGGGEFTTYWCTMDAEPAKVFAQSGSPLAQIVAGVKHVIYQPLGGEAAGNEDAAEIYYDPSYENIRAVGRDGTSVTLAGHPDKAQMPFVLDELQAVRTAPVRGAIRLAVGTAPVTVELDGVLYNEDGTPRANETVPASVTVFYSDGDAPATNMVIKTADYGVFGLSVPVDGSDGLAHNVTAVSVDALGPEPISVTMAPYALTASSVELLASNDYLPLYGDAVSIGNLAAGSISVTNSLNARSAASFTAGALKGFDEIDLERVDVAGGTLDWLGGQLPAAKSETFANLAEMTVGGGADADAAGTLSGRATRSWKAANDGFIQLQARCADPANTTLKLELLDAGGAVAAEVTPEGKIGNASAMRRFVWTVPVRKGDSLRLTMSAGELTLVKAQFIYFGVPE